ncbi:MAG TPA: hypothetical protein VHY08_05235 [Bacillota bacterium]|nr:hypothetical protein [Bacillota bacterium]
MGFFKNLFNSVKEGVKTAWEGIKQGNGIINSVVDGYYSAKEYFHEVTNDYKNEVNKYTETLKDEPAYNPSSQVIVDRAAEQLSYFLYATENMADNMEKRCFEECRSYYMSVIEYFQDNQTNIDLSLIKNYVEETKSQFKGFLKTYISKKISLDNWECVTILKLPPGLERNEQMTALQNKVLCEGLMELSTNINAMVQKQNTYIQSHFDGISQKIENKYQRMMEDCQKFESIENSNSDLKKQEIVNHSLIISYCDNILAELQN